MSQKKKTWLPWVMMAVVAGAGLTFFFTKLCAPKVIAANAFLEQCLPLRAGETIEYRFKGEDMIAFDVRRGGDGMFEPRVTPFDEGTFTAEENADYCLRFSNTLDRPQKIEYKVWRSKKQSE